MKTYKLIPIVLFSLITSIVFSQKVVKIDEKTRHYFEIPTSVEKTDYAVHFKNIVSKFDYIKFAVLLENKTSDYLIWNNANNKVIITDGDKDASKIKIYKVRPYKTINRTFDARGGNQLLVNDLFNSYIYFMHITIDFKEENLFCYFSAVFVQYGRI